MIIFNGLCLFFDFECDFDWHSGVGCEVVLGLSFGFGFNVGWRPASTEQSSVVAAAIEIAAAIQITPSRRQIARTVKKVVEIVGSRWSSSRHFSRSFSSRGFSSRFC